MKNRNAYYEEKMCAITIVFIIVSIEMIILNIAWEKAFWVGYFSGFLIFWGIPELIKNIFDLKFRYETEKLQRDIDSFFERLEKRLEEDK